MLGIFFLDHRFFKSAQSGFYFDFIIKKLTEVFVRNVFVLGFFFFAEKFLIEFVSKDFINKFFYNFSNIFSSKYISFINFFFYIVISILYSCLLYYVICVMLI